MRNRAWGFGIVELVIIVAILAVLAAIILPIFSKPRGGPIWNYCLNNQKQLALAVSMLTQENNETIPLPTEMLKAVDLNSKVFDCPVQEGVGTSEAPEYSFNAHLCNVSYKGKDANQRDRWEFTPVEMGEIDNPDGVELTTEVAKPFTWDAEAYPPEFAPFADESFQGKYVLVAAAKDAARPHQGGSITSYLDGHVVFRNPKNVVNNTAPYFCRYNLPNTRRIDIDFRTFMNENDARAAFARWFTVGNEGRWKDGAWIHPCAPDGHPLNTIGIRTSTTGINIELECSATGTLSVRHAGLAFGEMLRLSPATKDTAGQLTFGRPRGKIAGDPAASWLTKRDSGMELPLAQKSTRYHIYACTGFTPNNVENYMKNPEGPPATLRSTRAVRTAIHVGVIGRGGTKPERYAFSGVYPVAHTQTMGGLTLRCEAPANSTRTVTFYRISVSY